MALKGSSHCGLLPLYEEQTKQPIAISDPETYFSVEIKKSDAKTKRTYIKSNKEEFE